MAERDVPVVFVEGPPAYYSSLGFAPGAAQGFRKPSLRIPDAGFRRSDYRRTRRGCPERSSIRTPFGDTMPSAYAIRSSAARRG